MSGLLNKVKDLASNNNNTGNSGATDPNATSGGPDGTQTQGSGFDGKIDSALNNELTKEGVPAQYDQKIDGVVDSEIKKFE